MEIRLITPPQKVDGEQLLLSRMLDGGAEAVHLRRPSASIDEITGWIAHWPIRQRSKLILHAFPHLVSHFNLGGFHINQRTSKSTKERLLKERPFTLSYSAHSLDELDAIDPAITTVFLGPVFDSISKEGYQSKLNLKEVHHFLKQRSKRHYQLFALGGIREEKIPYLLGVGFDGVALLGRIWQTYQRLGEGESYRSFQAIQHETTKPGTFAHQE